MSELSAALETIQPELLAMTRLFGLPDAYWDPPARYRMQAEELPDTYRITFYFENLSAARETAIPSEPDPPCCSSTAAGPPGACASRPCMTCSAK